MNRLTGKVAVITGGGGGIGGATSRRFVEVLILVFVRLVLRDFPTRNQTEFSQFCWRAFGL